MINLNGVIEKAINLVVEQNKKPQNHKVHKESNLFLCALCGFVVIFLMILCL